MQYRGRSLELWGLSQRRFKGIRRSILLISFAIAQLCFAQKPGFARKVITRVEPSYPLILKVKHIEGQVRLHAVVLPNGSVAAIEVLGGNPILVENAIAAVKNWKYAPSATQTDEHVVLNFSAR
jgi:TonB family protein